MSTDACAARSADDMATVFVSYTRADAQWRRRFTEILKPVCERRIEVFSDERSIVGERWRPQLAAAIDRAHAALLLVSGPFLASDFIMKQELPALLKRGIPLVCVLVRSCLWDEVAELEEVQWAHDPRLDGPLESCEDPEAEIVRICKRLLELVPPEARGEPAEVLRGRGDPKAPPQLSELLHAEKVKGDLYGVPTLPIGVVSRREADGLRQALLAGDLRARDVAGKPLGLHGQGGIGKTVLATMLARDDVIRRRFPDGVFWISVGEREDLVAAQLDLLALLDRPRDELRSATSGLQRLRAALVDRRCLLIVDDVWSSGAAQAFAAVGPRGRVLYTTRDAGVLRFIGAEVHGVDALDDVAACQLLATLSGLGALELPDEADLVLESTGRVALALALVGAAIGHGGRTWDEVVDELRRGDRRFLDHPYANTFKAMQVGVGALERDVAEAYASLAVYPADVRIPVAAVSRYWSVVTDALLTPTLPHLETLAARGLISLSADTVGFHDLQRDFLLLHARDVGVLHADLLSAYRTLLPTRDSPWRELPQSEPYIWEHLVHHLRGLGSASEILNVTTDLGYLAVRAFRGGSHAAESDLREAAGLFPDNPVIAWLLRVFRQRGHLLAGHRRLEHLTATLASQIHDAPAALDVGALDGLVASAMLVTRWGLPIAPPELERVLEGHSMWVLGVAFSPDGRLLASAGGDGSVRLWDVRSGECAATLEGHAGWVRAVAFSPDGRIVASAGADGTVRLWDVATGAMARVLMSDGGSGMSAVAFSPDGHVLAAGGGDGSVRLWDVAGGVEIGVLRGHSGGVTGVAWSPRGDALASAGFDRSVRVWNPSTCEQSQAFEGHDAGVAAVCFAPDGAVVSSAGGDGWVRFWDIGSGAQLAALPHDGWVFELAYAPDGGTVASAGGDGSVCLWDIARGERTTTLECDGGLRGVAFSPNGAVLAAAGDDNRARLWNVERLLGPSVGREEQRGPILDVTFSPDGRILASAGSDGVVRLWDATSGAACGTLAGHSNGVFGVAFGPGGRVLASAGVDGCVRLWDAATGVPLPTTIGGHTGGIHGVAFSADGRVLVTAGADRVVRLWDCATGALTASLAGHADWVSGVATSPVGDLLATSGHDRAVRLWDVAAATETATLAGHAGWVLGVAFSPDGEILASAGDDGRVCLWDAATAVEIARLTGLGRVRAVAFSPDGRALATIGVDRSLRLWETASREEICRVRLETAARALAWGACGIAVATHTSIIRMDVVGDVARPIQTMRATLGT